MEKKNLKKILTGLCVSSLVASASLIGLPGSAAASG